MTVTRRPDPGPGQALTRALLALAEDRRRPRCAEPGGHHLWTSEDPEDRQQASAWCAGCPITGPCLDAAVDNRDTWGVRAGFDLGDPASRRAARTEHHLQRKAAS